MFVNSFFQRGISYLAISLAMLTGFACSTSSKNSATTEHGKDSLASVGLKESDVTNAYIYLMARYLVIHQEQADVSEDNLGYNHIKYNPLGKATFVNPNLDVAYLETWLAVDEKTCQVLDVPKIQNRYYTVQVIDEWAGVITNINQRTYSEHPHGRFAFCLKGTRGNTPLDAYRINLPSKKAKVLARIEIKGNEQEVLRLQQGFQLISDTNTKIQPAVRIPKFTNGKLIASDAFVRPLVDEVMNSAPDRMSSNRDLQNKVKAVAYYISQSPENKDHIEEIIRDKSIPEFEKYLSNFGRQKGGWNTTAEYVDGFGTDYWFRTATTYAGIWWNVSREVVYFMGSKDSSGEILKGDKTYLVHFPKSELPQTAVNAFWSLTALSVPDYRVIPNSLDRYKLSSTSKLTYGSDGSLTLAFGAKPRTKVPLTNWIPGPASGKRFTMTLRMYAPKAAVLKGQWFAPAIMKEESVEIRRTSSR